jgi:endonuclease G
LEGILFRNKTIRNLLVLSVLIGVYFVVQSVTRPDGPRQSPTRPIAEADGSEKKSSEKGASEKKNAKNANSIHTALGVPKDNDESDDFFMKKPQYELSYNNKRGAANWVCWNLNAKWFGDVERKQGQFITDKDLPDGFQRITHNDYTGSGFDRGHLVRSEERTATREDNDATFLMTNVLPQYHDLNAGPWLSLEEYCQILATKKNNELYLIAGGIYDETPKFLSGKGNGRVAIPVSTWKVIVVLEQGQGLEDVTKDTRIIAVNMPNREGKDFKKSGWRKYLTTVDELEKLTGYDFLSALPDDIESALESRTD